MTYELFLDEALELFTRKGYAGSIGASRFDKEVRQIRCVLAFGQLEYLSLRYFSVGWWIPRKLCLEQLTDSWYHLLVER